MGPASTIPFRPGKEHAAWSGTIAWLQGFGIALVVIGHSTQPVSWPAIPEPLRVIISAILTFHMPLFMAISGYLFAARDKPHIGWSKFLSYKARRLLVPYLFVGITGTALHLSVHQFGDGVRPNNLTALVHNVIFPWDNTVVYLWFLPTLFLVAVFSAPVARLLWGRLLLLAAVCFGLLVLSAYIGPDHERYPLKFLNLSGVGYYLGYFWLGICLFEVRHRMARALTNKSAVAALVGACGTAALAHPDLPGVLALRAICGVVASFALAMLWGKRHVSSVQTISRYSYQIYLLSWFFQVGALGIVCRQFAVGPYLCAALSISLGLAGPVMVGRLVESSGLPCRVLLGLKSAAPAITPLPHNVPA